MSGGGTGGHITPILAVADELKRLDPNCYIIYVGERGGQFSSMIEKGQTIDEIHTVFAGKYRRYHGESMLRRLFDFKTNLLNIRDGFLFAIGSLQAMFLIKKLRPDVVFLKGGFVGVPVGLAAALWNRIIVTHDSDAVPGLANRLISRWVNIHATGMPAEYYNFPKESARHVGVLVSKDYSPVDDAQQLKFKSELDIPVKAKLLLITGGSLGAQRLNTAVKLKVPELLDKHSDLYVIHQVGKNNLKIYDDYNHQRLQVLEFLKPMHVYTGAADLVVSRAGANTLAELGVQGKPCIVVPNPQLTGGHQLKNADNLKAQGAVEVVDELTFKNDQTKLAATIDRLLTDSSARKELSRKIQSVTIADASTKLAMILLEAGERSNKNR